MKYFNGFSLKGEEVFFKEQLIDNDFTVAGFSYGATKAFEHVYNSQERTDRLILLSPAFFQHHKKSFIRTQLRYYKADEKAYTKQFLKNVAYPSSIELDNYLVQGKAEELESLLSYKWDKEKLLELAKRGVTIEVFIGTEDKIVDAQKSFEFFSELVPCYFVKDVGHLLEG
jgi:alpha-beta hydrolase superfamily lysophospholipase